MDGTLKSSIKQFTQVNTIHANVGSSRDETNVHPIIVFALLPNKTMNLYNRLFNLIRQAVGVELITNNKC